MMEHLEGRGYVADGDSAAPKDPPSSAAAAASEAARMRATTSPSLRGSTENTPLPATLSGVVRSRTEGETGMPTESHQPWRARSAWTWAWGWGRRGTGRAAPDERRGGEARRIIGAGKKVGHWIAPPQCHRNRASRPLGPLPPTPTHRNRRLTTGLYVYMILTLIIYFTLG